MVYLIGGPPRVGKSLLAEMLLKQNHIPYVSTDLLVHMLKKAAPQLGVTDKNDFIANADIFYPYLEQFVKLAGYDANGYTVEGCVVMPRQVSQLSEKFTVKSVFLGFSQVTLDDIIAHLGSNDWINDLTPEAKQKMPEYIIKLSKIFQDESAKFGYRYFDMSLDFDQQLRLAYNFLIDS